MINTFIEIIRNITRLILLFLIILIVIVFWWFSPTDTFHYDENHPNIGSKIVFKQWMFKVENVTEGYGRKDFSDEYRNYIMARGEGIPESSVTENVEDDESFVIKSFFRFTRRGTGFRSDTNSTYYVLEDKNKKTFILKMQFMVHNNKPLYKDYKYIISD